jgi:hypothetical protein
MRRIVVLSALCLSAVVRAQTPPPSPPAVQEDELARAKVHFQQGVALYNDGNFGAALAEFDEAYRLHPTPGVLYNIGLTQKSLFRYSEAIDSLERYLRDSTGLAPERRAEVQQLVNEMKALLADVTVEVTPPGANITVDGRTAGQAPLAKPLGLAAGSHTIEASADGFQSLKKELLVTAGVAVAVKLALVAIPKSGKVHITATAPDAMVFIDGKPFGMAPVDAELAAGGHTLEVTSPRHDPSRQELVIAAGQARDVPVTLTAIIPKKRWYEQWYVWTPIAAVVAGTAIGLGVGLGTRQSPVEGTLAPGVGGVQ